MSTRNDDDSTHGTGGRPRRGWLGAAGWLTLGALAGVAGSATVGVYAHRGAGMFSHGPASIESVQERVADRAAWVIGAVDATPEQEKAIKGIVATTVNEVYPLVGKHRDNKREFIELLARPQLDAATLDALRKAELGLLDEASAAMAGALLKMSAVLEPEQRQTLLRMAARHRRHGHH